MSDDYKKQATVFFISVGLFIAIMFMLPSTMREQAVDLQCKLRLKRLGDAVSYWVFDHQFNGFPPIKNPKPHTPWQPNRIDSAASILSEFLGGNLPTIQRENESPEAYRKRLLKKELTVCPKTGLEFWYESVLLDEMDPRKIAEAPEHHAQTVRYFRCQLYPDGSEPYEVDDVPGHYEVYGSIVNRVVNQKDVEALRSELNRREKENAGKSPNEWTHDLLYLRKRVSNYEESIKQHPEGFPAITLDREVKFSAEQ